MGQQSDRSEHTYDDLEADIERREGSIVRSLVASVRSRFGGADVRDPEVVRERRQSVVGDYRDRTAAATALIEKLESNARDVRDRGEELSLDVSSECEDVTDRLDSLRALRDENPEYLRADEHDRLGSLESNLRELQAFLESTRAFDESIDSVTTSIETLRETAAPIRNYEAYLTRPMKVQVRTQLADSRRTLEEFEDRITVDALAGPDRERLAELRDVVETVDSTLEAYNETFVERQCEEYAELFTDVDSAGHDLNEAQQRAIVRNGIYNQVIAPAGTGKTFALTYRVAYLVAEGVDPDRIVALTYTTEGASEMEDRLEDQFGITAVEVRAIHSFAYRIAREASDSHRSVADDQLKRNCVEEGIREETNRDRSSFADHYLQFCYHYDDSFLDETSFEEKSAYVAERRNESYRTLAGEEVASRTEKRIADFLFVHDVTYRYEAIAEWAETAPEKGPYRPDFYLPEYDSYLEHWGLDETGSVAPWFSWSTPEYLGKLRWARREFERTEYRLIETYEFEYEADRLERALRHRLRERGVELDRMDFEDFAEPTYEYDAKERDIVGSFVAFIENAKAFGITPDEIDDRLTRRNPGQYHFGKCAQHLLRRYNEYLERNGLIDFDDMIYEAIDAIEARPDPYRSRYDHVLVDEFQDVAMSQIRLVRNLVGAEWDTRLFCVGDDWQRIYSFQGSAVEYFIDFETHFGPAVQTFLTKNYRCPETVLEAGNELIRNNDRQIEKDVIACSGRDSTPQLHTLDGYRDDAYERRLGEYVADLVEQLLEGDSEPDDVMILCRYDGSAPYLETVKRKLRGRDIPYDGKNDHYRPPGTPQEGDDAFDPDGGVSVFSVHQSKGREAKHVVLVHAATGRFGFPADDRDDELIAPVQDVETNTVAEERRLFYVAITRTERDLHVLTRADEKSPFVTEIAEYLWETRSLAAPGELGETVSLTAKVATIWEDTHEAQRQAGVLEDDTATTRFVSWERDDPVEIEEGTWYRFEDVKLDEFDDEPQIVIQAGTTVTELSRETDAPRIET